VIITSCSHAGICNIVEYAKKICEDNRIIDIVGGFHLLNWKGSTLREQFSKCTLGSTHRLQLGDFCIKKP